MLLSFIQPWVLFFMIAKGHILHPNKWMKWSESRSVVSNSLRPHGLYNPWNSPGQNTGVGSLSLLQGISLTQGLNPGLPHCSQILYQLSHKRSPRILEWVACPFSVRSSWSRDWTGVSCIAGVFFTNWAIREAPRPNKVILKNNQQNVSKEKRMHGLRLMNLLVSSMNQTILFPNLIKNLVHTNTHTNTQRHTYINGGHVLSYF